jgi:hypothetical protein
MQMTRIKFCLMDSVMCGLTWRNELILIVPFSKRTYTYNSKLHFHGPLCCKIMYTSLAKKSAPFPCARAQGTDLTSWFHNVVSYKEHILKNR